MKWRRLRTLIQREVRATLRDTFTVVMLIAVPVGTMLSFGFVLSTEVKHLPLAVLDADGGPASRRLIADLTANGTFDARRYATRMAIDRALVSGEASAALIIPPEFDRRLRAAAVSGEPPPSVQVIYDGAETTLAGNAEGFLRSLVAATGADITAETRAGPGVGVVTRALFNPGLDGVPFMVAGTFGFVLSFLTTLITAVSIVNEKIAGTFEQLQVTPATSMEIFLGKILPLGAVFVLDVVLMMVVAGLVFDVWPHGSVLFFIGVSAFYVLISLALGLIFSATSATPAEAVQKTVLFSIPLVQLSGFAFPIRNMPAIVQWLADVLPATHYIRISRAVYMRAAGPAALLPELGALFLFGAVLLWLALRSIEARS